MGMKAAKSFLLLLICTILKTCLSWRMIHWWTRLASDDRLPPSWSCAHFLRLVQRVNWICVTTCCVRFLRSYVRRQHPCCWILSDNIGWQRNLAGRIKKLPFRIAEVMKKSKCTSLELFFHQCIIWGLIFRSWNFQQSKTEFLPSYIWCFCRTVIRP